MVNSFMPIPFDEKAGLHEFEARCMLFKRKD
jgi:hypothetical protein